MSNVLVIAGMHRSGTSLTASWLHKMGLFMGNNLMSSRFDNIKGHFEDLDILKIHENDLKGKKMQSTGLRFKKNFNFNLSQNSKEEIVKIVSKRERVGQWGWKEPRGTLFLKDWKEIIPELKCLAVYRHYDKVVESLIRRIKYSIYNTKSFKPINRLKLKMIFPIYIKREIIFFIKAWISYNDSIIEFHKNYPNDCILINIEDFLAKEKIIFNNLTEKFHFYLDFYEYKKVFNENLLNTTEKKIKLPKNISGLADNVYQELVQLSL